MSGYIKTGPFESKAGKYYIQHNPDTNITRCAHVDNPKLTGTMITYKTDDGFTIMSYQFYDINRLS